MKKTAKKPVLDNNPNYYALAAGLVIIIISIFLYFYPFEQTTGMATTDSTLGNFTANIGTNIDCVWSDAALSVGFGDALSQGSLVNATQNYNATSRNETMYNITIGTTSNVEVNVTIKGADMESGVNVIGIGNITWDSNNTLTNDAESGNATTMVYTGSYNLETDYDTTNFVATNISKGNVTWYRFWLTVPSSTVAGDYTGNYTMQCSEH